MYPSTGRSEPPVIGAGRTDDLPGTSSPGTTFRQPET